LLIRTRRENPPALALVRGPNFPKHVNYGLSRLRIDIPNINEKSIFGLNNSAISQIWSLILEALDLIKICWRDAGTECSLLIREVVLISGPWLRSATLNSTFGVIYLCPRNDWTVANYVDLIIHETGHHSLEVKSSMLEFLRNPSEFGASPLRDGHRPMYAVLHAAFVLARVVSALRRIIDKGPASLNDNLRELEIMYREKLRDACAALENCAKWTIPGEALFDEIRQTSRRGILL
jgi:HEXXH motif-containing protein